MMNGVLRYVAAVGVFSSYVSAQAPRWCGKPYEAGSPQVILPADARLSYPPKFSLPLLNFQCNPVLRPYISNEDVVGGLILDAEISYDVGQPFRESIDDNSSLHVIVNSSGRMLGAVEIRLGTKGTVLEFPLELLGKGRLYHTTLLAPRGWALLHIRRSHK